MSFEELSLIQPILRAVRVEGYTRPTPIQEKAIPHILAGRDLLGCAQTGTGKTAAFALPILQIFHGSPRPAHAGAGIRALVLSPTRELAAQIGDSFAAYGRHTGLRHTVVFGGVGQGPQVDALRRGVDILVATPGRLLDLMEQGLVKLRHVQILVLDEADRMLDMGFIPDVRRIVAALPVRRQTLFFSATLSADIERLAGDIVRDPVRVNVAPAATTVEAVDQKVYFVEKPDKRDLLVDLLRKPAMTRALVFTRTKHGADRVAQHLYRAGLRVHAIHGNKSQGARQRALEQFRNGRVQVLVATDIAARGLDIDGVTHVFNLDLPNEPEVYVHRIGRTARAEASGVAISFCSPEERVLLAAIQRLIREDLEVVGDHPFHSRPARPRSAYSQPSEQRPRSAYSYPSVPRPRSASTRSHAPRPLLKTAASPWSPAARSVGPARVLRRGRFPHR
ncbi:MAG: DEAD/DEAH box helicase [Planctomycetes bacterium]|nr:DEAD/DEAH box helicase [Planctomycetota bacterium]